MRDNSVPYWLSGGFRPFFMLGALTMAGAILAWISMMAGMVELPTAFVPRDWHIHTMLFGGIPAIVAGFALTAVANWTGRPPVAGFNLALLVVLWIAGRVSVSVSGLIGAPVTAVIDLLFPIVLTAVFAREVIAGGNLRNLRVVAVVALLGAANAAFHIEAARFGIATVSPRAGVAIVLVLVMLVGGRIIPAFTRNWMMQRKATRLPAGFSRLDGVSILVSATALIAWVAVPAGLVTAGLLAIAAAANVFRLARWCGLQTMGEPLLAFLHVGYSTVPLGFAAVSISILAPGVLDPVAAVHVWTVGTFGAMTLAVMARASRGHSGRGLVAGPLDIVMFGLVLVGATARVVAPHTEGWLLATLDIAGLNWALAYLLFAFGYGPMLLVRPRRSGRAA